MGRPRMKFIFAVAICLVATTVAEDAAPSNMIELSMDNFVEIVTDAKKHVVVEFYAPWCGHCKEFAPTYDKIAEKYSGNDEIVIAKLDSEAHAVFAKMYKVTSYPTIKVFKKADKKGAIFEGERNEEALSEFIDKETYEEPVVPAREPPKVSDARIAHIPAWPNKLRLMLVAVYVG